MKKSLLAASIALSLGAMSLAGCADAPGTGTTTPTASTSTSATSKAPMASFKACMVSDSGGFDDKSFNQTSHDGLVKAKTDLGIETGEVESKDVKLSLIHI